MTFPRKAVRIRFAFHQPFMLRVKKSVKSRLFRVSWWSGIDLSVLSPKPLVVGSSPTAPAKKKARKALILQGFLCLFVLPEADFRRVRFSFFILHYTRFIP